MLLRQREAGIRLDRVAARTLRLGCAAFLLALRLAAAPTAPGNAKITVAWNAVIGATSYNVYRSLTQGGPYGSPPSPARRAAEHSAQGGLRLTSLISMGCLIFQKYVPRASDSVLPGTVGIGIPSKSGGVHMKEFVLRRTDGEFLMFPAIGLRAGASP